MNIVCSTCLEPITLKCSTSTTPCGHLFHTKCIEEWLHTDKWANVTKGIQKSCPQCRSNCDFLVKLYFTQDVEVESKIDFLETKSENLQKEVTNLQNDKIKLEKNLEELKNEFSQDNSNKFEPKVIESETKLKELKKENTKLKKSKSKLEKRLEKSDEEMKDYVNSTQSHIASFIKKAKESDQCKTELKDLVKNFTILANELVVTNKFMTSGVDEIIEAFTSRLDEAFKQQKDGLTLAQQREKECIFDLGRKNIDAKKRTETIIIEILRLTVAFAKVSAQKK